MRRVLLACAFAFCAAAVPGLVADTRDAVRVAEPVVRTLGVSRMPALVLLVQERDCADAGEMVRRWDASRPAAAALHVVVAGDVHALRRVRSRLPLPRGASLHAIGVRRAALAGARLGYRETPFAVFLDARGRVLATSPGDRIPPSTILRSVYGR